MSDSNLRAFFFLAWTYPALNQLFFFHARKGQNIWKNSQEYKTNQRLGATVCDTMEYKSLCEKQYIDINEIRLDIFIDNNITIRISV